MESGYRLWLPATARNRGKLIRWIEADRTWGRREALFAAVTGGRRDR